MKRFLIIFLLLMFCFAIEAAVVSYPDLSQFNKSSKWGVVQFQLDDTDANTVTLSTDYVFGVLQRITIDSNGTETDWSVVIKDDIGLTLFSKTDCNSLTEPYGYAIYEDDTEGNPHYGIPIFGKLTLTVSDVNFAAEIQTLDVDANPTDGNLTLAYLGQETVIIDHDADVAAVQAAIDALSTVESGDITVASAGTLATGDAFTFTFLAAKGDVPMLVVDSNLTGATASIVQTKRGGSDLDMLNVTVYYFNKD